MVDTFRLSYIWMNYNVNCSRNILLNTVAINLKNQFKQQLKSDIEESSRCLKFKIFNIDLKKISSYFKCFLLTNLY